MAHGGKRPGAGRRPGSTTQKTRDIADKAAKEGITPLEFMLQVMRDEAAERSERLDMAKAAAPYVHPRLSAVEAKVQSDVSLEVEAVEWRVVDPSA